MSRSPPRTRVRATARTTGTSSSSSSASAACSSWGLAVLALLYGTAIFAPFLANDRPFASRPSTEEYGTSAVSSLRPVTDSTLDGPPRGADRRGLPGSSRPRGRWATLRTPDASSRPRGGDRARGASGRALDAAGGRQRGRGPGHALRDRGGSSVDRLLGGRPRRVRSSPPGGPRPGGGARCHGAGLRPAREEAGGLKLVAHRATRCWSPSGLDLFFMSLWLLLVGWPVWNPLLNGCSWAGTASPFVAGDGASPRGPGGLDPGRRGLVRRGSGRARACTRRLPLQGGPHRGRLTLSRLGTSWAPGDGPTCRPSRRSPTAGGDPPGGAVPAPDVDRGGPRDEDGRYLRGPRSRRRGRGRYGGGRQSGRGALRRAAPEPAPSRHLAGVDELGRDFLARMMWGRPRQPDGRHPLGLPAHGDRRRVRRPWPATSAAGSTPRSCADRDPAVDPGLLPDPDRHGVHPSRR